MDRNQAIQAAKAAGYTHVATAAGWVRLQDWQPYGCTKDQPVWASKDFPNFKLFDDEKNPRLEDQPPERTNSKHERINGVWSLMKEEVK